MYLMSVTFAMYFRPFEADAHTALDKKADPGMNMKLPFAVLGTVIVLCGLFSNNIITVLESFCTGVL